MAENLRAELKLTYSENTDFTSPEWVADWGSDDTTPSEAQLHRLVATTGGQTLNLDHLTSGARADFSVQNTDGTNFVSVTVRFVGDADDAVVKVHPKEIVKFSIDPVTDPIFTADTANVDVRVVVAQ